MDLLLIGMIVLGAISGMIRFWRGTLVGIALLILLYNIFSITHADTLLGILGLYLILLNPSGGYFSAVLWLITIVILAAIDQPIKEYFEEIERGRDQRRRDFEHKQAEQRFRQQIDARSDPDARALQAIHRYAEQRRQEGDPDFVSHDDAR